MAIKRKSLLLTELLLSFPTEEHKLLADYFIV